MSNVITILRRELQSYFNSWIAYVLMGLFALLTGYFYYVFVYFFVERSATGPAMGGGPMNVNEWVIRPLLQNISVIGLFLIPAITMRLFAEEKRSGTMELLATSPVRDWEIVLGKWLAAWILYACILAVSVLNVALLYVYGKPDLYPILTGYLGLLLQGGCLLAVGTFLSNTTRNQVIAGTATFVFCLLLWVLDWLSSYESTAWAKVLAYLSVTSHFEPFAKGVIDSKDIIFYISMIFFGLFITTRSLESVRWRA